MDTTETMIKMDFTRQMSLLNMDSISQATVSLIGAGSIGSFTALTIAKMGIQQLEVYDDDGITDHNIPNQFYRLADVGQFKVDALEWLLFYLCGTRITTELAQYTNQKLQEIVIVATDSMRSRKAIWDQFRKQEQCHTLIEARMGAELGIVYTIRKREKSRILGGDDVKFLRRTTIPR